VNGTELRRFREESGWSQDQLADLLKASLGRGSSTTVGKWENGQRPVPDDVASLVSQLMLERAYPLPEERVLEGEHEEPGMLDASPVGGDTGDTAPPEPGERSRDAAPGGQLPLPGGSTSYARVCEELWELIATGLGMVGAATGAEGLKKDGEIIHADKQALGRAWGKLAETNDTFRRMLLGATSGGAWMEVALVSGITFGKCYRSHQEIGARKRAELEAQVEEGVEAYGDGAQPVRAAA